MAEVTTDEDRRAVARRVRASLPLSAQTQSWSRGPRRANEGPDRSGSCSGRGRVHAPGPVERGRPVRRGPFKGLSAAECYRVADTMSSGEPVSERRLAEPALSYAQYFQKTVRSMHMLVLLFVATVLVRLVIGGVTGRRLALDILALAALAIVTVTWRLRMPRVRQAAQRTEALHRG